MKRIKVELIQDGLRLEGINRNKGDIVDLPQGLLVLWKEKGYCKEKEEEPPTPPEPPQEPELNHVGGGYYLLPNGEKIKGKEAALEALKALKGGKENDSKTYNGSNSGANNNGGSSD